MQAQSTHLAALAITTLLQLGSAHAAQGDFPYDALVVGDAATVYAGPGPQYYDTAELPSGARVQVYEQTPGGFCAIRPPEGSYSWAPASSLRLIGDGTAEVTRDQTPSRVGSLLHDRRDAVHVRLDRGERVRVLTQQEIDGVGWVQIAPPSGEFRWLRREDLTTDPMVLATAPKGENPATENGWVQAAAHTGPAHPGPAGETDQSPAPPAAEVTGARPLPPADAQTPQRDAGDPPADTAGPRGTLELTGDFRSKLSALEIELSRQVAERPTLWRFDEIEHQAAGMLAAANTEPERDAVRDLAARVDRFAAIANRYKAARGLAPQVGLTKSRLVEGTPPTINPLAESVAPVSGYDAVGTLRPVVSKRPNAPQYALVDNDGKIVSFITASPDLNLSSLIGQRVGVQGGKGFMPEYQQPHVTAQRVASLRSSVR